MIMFLLIKIIRDDFRYWMNLSPGLSLTVSFMMRCCAKLLADFTLMMQLRHSYEVGGVQFCWLVIQNQAGCFVAGWFYLKYFDEAADGVNGSTKLGAETLWAGLVGLFGLFLVSGLAFVGLMDRKYLGTFITTMTAKQLTTEKFRTATNDQQRTNVMTYHPSYYKEVEVELQELIVDNWDDWMKNRPVWLTDNIIASVPDEFLKKEEVVRLMNEGGGRRIRNSAFGGMGGGGGGRASAKVRHDANTEESKQSTVVSR